MLSWEWLFLFHHLWPKAPQRVGSPMVMRESRRGKEQWGSSCSASCTGGAAVLRWVQPPGSVSLLHPWLLPGPAGSGCRDVPSPAWQLCSTKPALHSRQAWSLPRDFPGWIFCSLAWVWLKFLSQQTGSVLRLCDNNDLLLHSEPVPSSSGPIPYSFCWKNCHFLSPSAPVTAIQTDCALFCIFRTLLPL